MKIVFEEGMEKKNRPSESDFDFKLISSGTNFSEVHVRKGQTSEKRVRAQNSF